MIQRILYEYPLNERIRSLLRLEFLFRQLAHSNAGESEWDARFALQSLFQVQELCVRKELKGELSRELRRQADALDRHRASAGIDLQALDMTLSEVRQTDAALLQPDGESGGEALQLAQHNLLNSVRQRISIPGGTCRFDLPALHHWLQTPLAHRHRQMDAWLRPMTPIRQAVDLILELLRASAIPRQTTAVGGFYQQSPNHQKSPQLARVVVAAEPGLFPEFSGNGHRYSIRFLSQPDISRRPRQTTDDVDFRLACCGL